MKAVLEFEFPKDDVEFYWATNGATMNLVLWKMDQWLRSQTKHGIPSSFNSIFIMLTLILFQI